jgi:chemotaxis protein methyltransferase CheR
MNNHFSVENFEKIKEFIYRKTGISIDFGNTYEKLKNHIDDFKDYFFKLRFDDDGTEFQKLINIVTNNETYFYREKEHFEVLVKHILPKIDKELPKNQKIRILSAPCSSGEEVYSMVLHVLQENSIKRDIEIVGIDIDSDAIKEAKEALYREKSVQNLSVDIQERYFIKKGNDYILDKNLKKDVSFLVVNVYDKEQMSSLGKFDVIFSRNMFIYFDEVSRKDVAISFYNMLNENGSVILGNSEHMSRIISLFSTSKIDNVFVHRKIEKK